MHIASDEGLRVARSGYGDYFQDKAEVGPFDAPMALHPTGDDMRDNGD